MRLNLAGLKAEVAAIKEVVPSVVATMNHVAAKLSELRAEGGGALQNEIDQIVSELRSHAVEIGRAIAIGTAAENEVPDEKPPVDPLGDAIAAGTHDAGAGPLPQPEQPAPEAAQTAAKGKSKSK